jgi:deferrochelatase/peroxidase EfeB
VSDVNDDLGPASPTDGRDATGGISRRRFLGWVGAAGVGAAAGAGGVGLAERATGAALPAGEHIVPFNGRHQAGIATSQQRNVVFASLDAIGHSRAELAGLLRYWTNAAARMTRGLAAAEPRTDRRRPPWDTGEALGLGPSRLTMTFGVGPSLFDGRFGLASARPSALRELPRFSSDELDPALSGGDLCIQACADDEQVAFHAVRELARLGHGIVTVRWSQAGFLPEVADGETPRNLLGFKDGTNNIRPDEAKALRRFVWVGNEGPAWLRGGSYVVARRIEFNLDRWDGSSLEEQENTFGRLKVSGAPFGGATEHDLVNLTATGAGTIPANAHVRLANPATNGGERILRRPYSFVDRGQGRMRAGLFFLAYQRDPVRQFVAIQRRLAAHDALNEYIVHTGSALFAMFHGVRRDESVAAGLL